MDIRQQRTRRALFDAVMTLAQERPVGDLTMSEVARAAGVHRATVYGHARSPADLVQLALEAELDRIRERLPVGEGETSPAALSFAVAEVTREVVEHITSHIEIYRQGLLDESPTFGLAGMLSRHFQDSGALVSAAAGVDIVGADVPQRLHAAATDAALRFIADGTVGVITGWLAAPQPSVDDFMVIYESMLPPWWPHPLAHG